VISCIAYNFLLNFKDYKFEEEKVHTRFFLRNTENHQDAVIFEMSLMLNAGKYQ